MGGRVDRETERKAMRSNLAGRTSGKLLDGHMSWLMNSRCPILTMLIHFSEPQIFPCEQWDPGDPVGKATGGMIDT